MQNLIVTFIQTELVWEDIQANLEMLDKKIEAIENPSDLILLPEMFSTGFSMTPAGLAETMQGSAVTWMKKKARDKSADIAGSLMIEEDGRYFQSPDLGKTGWQDTYLRQETSFSVDRRGKGI